MVPNLVNDILQDLSEPFDNPKVDKIREKLHLAAETRLGHIIKTDNLAIRAALFDPKYAKLEFVDKNVKDAAWAGIIADNRPVLKEKSLYPQDLDFYEQEVLKLKKFFENADLTQISKQVDCLNWWKNYKSSTILPSIARRYLCIPATSTSSERAFSDAGFIYNKRRAALDEDTVEMLVFIRENWEYVEEIDDLGEKIKTWMDKKKSVIENAKK